MKKLNFTYYALVDTTFLNAQQLEVTWQHDMKTSVEKILMGQDTHLIIIASMEFENTFGPQIIVSKKTTNRELMWETEFEYPDNFFIPISVFIYSNLTKMLTFVGCTDNKLILVLHTKISNEIR